MSSIKLDFILWVTFSISKFDFANNHQPLGDLYTYNVCEGNILFWEDWVLKWV